MAAFRVAWSVLKLEQGNEYLPLMPDYCMYKIERYETIIVHDQDKLIESDRVSHMQLETLGDHKISGALLTVSKASSTILVEITCVLLPAQHENDTA
jgi:hypothetical protein